MDIKLTNITKRVNDLYKPNMDSSFVLACEIRGSIALTSPCFTFTDTKGELEYWHYNYLYVPSWRRYYFIDDAVINGHLIYLYCSEDYLASFYDEIINSTFYCTRSFSDYDESLTDTFFPCKAFSETRQVTIKSPWQDIPNGQYVVAITSGGNNITHIGSNAYYVMDNDEITDFMDNLLSKAELSISGIVDNLVKTMVNPIQYIRSVYWFPFTLDCDTVSVDNISFGWWSSGASAKVINGDHIDNFYTKFSVTIPFDEYLFNEDEREYLKFAPYSQYTLVCYPFGVIQLSNDIISQYIVGNDLKIDINVDHITGMATFVLYCGTDNDIPHLTFTTQLAIEIPVGEVLQNYAGTILNSVNALTSGISGNVGASISDVYNAIDSIVPTATVQGIAGGFAQLMFGESWHLNRYVQDITIDSELVGEPCCKNMRVGNLSGYAKFAEVEVKGSMLKSEMQALDNLLENGIFIGD